MKYFKISEFDCKHTGENKMYPPFLELLDELRGLCGFPFVITSGYRSENHPIEASKETPGYHSMGLAADIAAHDGASKYIIVKNAIQLGFSGIGIDDTFIHVDTRPDISVIWTY